MKYFNRLLISGYISRINTDSDKSVWFDIAQNNKYKKDGNEIEESFFYNVRMSKEKYESNKEMFEIGKAVVVRGSIRNYMDKYNNKISFINCNSVKEYVDEPKK